MLLTRRAFAAAFRPPDASGDGQRPAPVRIDANENPNGPCRSAVAALREELDSAGRYPTNSRVPEAKLVETLSAMHGARADNLVLGAGSRELLRNAVRAFTSPEAALVTAAPSYEQPERTAEMLGAPVRRVPVDGDLRLDLAGMAEAALGAGLVFVCNPNNPTATVRSGAAVVDLVEHVRARSPRTVVLIDEAYHDYVTDPAYRTAVPLALAHPNVLVARTLSKAHGMAGLRLGYALGQPETVSTFGRYRLPFNVNVLAMAAAVRSLGDGEAIAEERRRNAEVRALTVRTFAELGRRASDSQANFVFVDLGRPARAFREACQQRGVLVGRDFPPFERTHARVSIGTADEMRRALAVFKEVLA